MSDSDLRTAHPRTRLAVVVGFTLFCAGIFGFLWQNSGGSLPLVSSKGYEVTVAIPRVANTVYFSDVMMAGIKVGKVTEVQEQGDRALVTMRLDDDVAPVHQGASVQVRAKSLVEESFLDITDGTGREVPSGSTLPAGSGKPPVQLNDVLSTLDKPTRAELRTALRSLGAGTEGTGPAIAAAVQGLGALGRQGRTATDALADQSADLQALTRSSTQVLAALTQRQGQLASLVRSTSELADATAGQSKDVEAFVRALPPVLTSAQNSSDDLTRLGQALQPVAANLRTAAPALTTALRELPATSRQLRALMPDATQALDKAPATLTRVPRFSDDVDALLPEAGDLLSELNPMLGYLQPYGRDLAAWFTNFSQTIALGDANGKAFRVMPIFNEQSYKGIPLSTNVGPLDHWNPMPAPNSLDHLRNYDGTYDRVKREPAPK